MRVYFIDLKKKTIINYLAKKFDNFESSYQITHYDGGKSVFQKCDFNLFRIESEI